MKGMLEEAGITCEVRNETIYPVMPGAPFQPEVWVREEDYVQACEVIDGWGQTISHDQSEETAEEMGSSRTDALFRCFAGLLITAGPMGLALKARRAEAFVAALVLGVSLGAVLLWSGVAQLRKLARRRKEH